MQNDKRDKLTIIGGGLAGSEAAWQAAQLGVHVDLFEMRPQTPTGAHTTGNLAELVCSNSLGSNLPDRATGLLINELRSLNSLLIQIADRVKVPAGGALAVDRDAFSQAVTRAIEDHPNISIIRTEVDQIPSTPVVIATGPLTSERLLVPIQALIGGDSLFFYDAIAPIIYRDSINMQVAFKASRYDRGQEEEGDYINCPLTREQYGLFTHELVHAERIQLHGFEQDISRGVKSGTGFFFERCLPVEILAARGDMAMAYGPMRPVGVTDPKTGRWPFAIVQLRQDDLCESLFNMVGFQTNLTFTEQKRVLRMIPGLEKAEFARYGQMHRNTFLCSPLFLNTFLQHQSKPHVFFAGQLMGVEGYAGNIASGLLAGLNSVRYIRDEPMLELPKGTMIGAIINYVTQANPDHFQPMKANFGLLPVPITPRRINKRLKYQKMVQSASEVMKDYLLKAGLE